MQKKYKIAVFSVVLVMTSLALSAGLFYYLKTDGFSLDNAIETKTKIIEKAKGSNDQTVINNAKVAEQELAILKQKKVLGEIENTIAKKSDIIERTGGAVTPDAILTRISTERELIDLKEQHYSALATYKNLQEAESHIVWSYHNHNYTKKELITLISSGVMFYALLILKFMIFRDRYLK